MISIRIKFFTLLLLLFAPKIYSQNNIPVKYNGFTPRDTSQTMVSVAAGMGVPYAFIGGKILVGNKYVTGDFGLGMLPLAWTPAFSIGGACYFRDRYESIRPKISISYSTCAAAILILDQDDMEPMYDEMFSGIGVYLGIDWRLSKTSPLCLDLNVGWVFPSVGNDEIERKYDEAVDDLRSRNIMITYEKLNLDTPKISVGISYAPARSLK